MPSDEDQEGYREFKSRRYRDPRDAQAAALELLRPPGRVEVIRRKVENHGITIEEAKQIVAFGAPATDKRHADRTNAFAWLPAKGRCKAVFFIKELEDATPFLLIATAYPVGDASERFR